MLVWCCTIICHSCMWRHSHTGAFTQLLSHLLGRGIRMIKISLCKWRSNSDSWKHTKMDNFLTIQYVLTFIVGCSTQKREISNCTVCFHVEAEQLCGAWDVCIWQNPLPSPSDWESGKLIEIQNWPNSGDPNLRLNIRFCALVNRQDMLHFNVFRGSWEHNFNFLRLNNVTAHVSPDNGHKITQEAKF